MRQIIYLQLGQCGNQIGAKFWELISEEHSIDSTGVYYGTSNLQIQRISTYFNQVSNGKYVPRAILTDLQPGALDNIKGSSLGSLFKPDNFIFGQKGAGNNWAKGYYGQGSEVMDSIMDAIRSEAEGCDALQGFQMAHSIGGGTGSGMGSLLLSRLKQEFNERIIQNFSIFPSQKVSDTVVQPYNAVLSTHHLIQNTEGCMVLDNQALFDICYKTLKIEKPTHGDLNHLVSLSMSGITSSLRFRSLMNSDMRKMSVNLVPYPRQHFFMVGLAPLFKKDFKIYKELNTYELIQQTFDAKNMLCGADPRHGRYLTGFVTFRGKIASSQIEWPYIVTGKNSSYFVEWIPNNFKGIICDIRLNDMNKSATIIGNSTAIQQVFRRIGCQFDLMFKRRAFVHWYTDEGLDELQFSQAYENMNDIISQYQLSQDATVQWDYQEQQQA